METAEVGGGGGLSYEQTITTKNHINTAKSSSNNLYWQAV